MIEISRELIFAETGNSKILREFNFADPKCLEDFKTKETRIVVNIWSYFLNFFTTHHLQNSKYIPIIIIVIRYIIDRS